MNKINADRLIVEYQQKIFGFAMSKMRDVDNAEELASNIVLEVYKSFLKSDNIANIEGYVYRIASNVYDGQDGHYIGVYPETLEKHTENCEEKLECCPIDKGQLHT